MKEEKYWKSMDQMNRIHVVIWTPETPCKAVVLLSHGMIEYVERYAPFAAFLNAQGIAVIGNDHLGHGLSVKCEDDFGFFGDGQSKVVVEDFYKVTRYAKKRFGTKVPYILFGHSMGSFLARRYLMTYGNTVDGAILAGTGYHHPVELAFGLTLAKAIECTKGQRYRSTLLKNLAFGIYNWRIKNPRTAHDWLSRDPAVVDAYRKDPLCQFIFTVNGYQTLFRLLWYIAKDANAKRIPKELPILMIAGEQDPVGSYGTGVKKVYNQYKRLGIDDIDLILYEKDRHELLNEPDHKEVYSDIYTWMQENILNPFV